MYNSPIISHEESEPHVEPDAEPDAALPDTDTNSSETLSEKEPTSVSNSSSSSTRTSLDSFPDSSSSEPSDVDMDLQFGAAKTHTSMKFVGDNLDKDVLPAEMRSDYQKRSLHYFHCFAVDDRIDLSGVSDEKVQPDLQSIQLTELLPTGDDEEMLRTNFTTLISRVLVKHMKYFAQYSKAMDRHIRHDFSKEMAMKSEVVSALMENSMHMYIISLSLCV